MRQPGEPTAVDWEFANPDARQGLQFKLRAVGTNGAIANPTIEIDQAASLTVPVEVAAGQSLLVEGDGVARVYDAKGSQVKAVPLKGPLPELQAGRNRLRFDCEFQGTTSPKVALTLKTRGAPSRVPGAK